ncbi:hypothetical protein [Alteromonas phage JH01]|nr:hypothetical protein [Alteromonas phage JH01]
MQHSRFGASRIATVLACPGFNNATLDYDLSVDDLSMDEKAAELGRAAHEASEHCLKLGINPEDALGSEFNDHVVDEVMAENITVYTNHIRSLRLQNPNAKSLIEAQLFMSSVAHDVWGWADHIMIAGDTLYIDDLKYGFVVVNEEDNAQCAHYAVSALDTFKLWFKIKRVVCTIIQPRADHVQGSVRTVEYTIDELAAWRDKFVTGIAAARKKDAPRKAGEHCRYCPARATCRQRMIRTVFKASLDAPLKTCSDEELEALLREIPTIRKHLEAVEEHATLLARGGKLFNDFKLVKSRVHAVVNDEKAFLKLMEEKGIPKHELYNPGRMKGKTALRPLLDKKGVDVNDHFTTPNAPTKLVPITHSSTAVSRTARGVFKPIKD